jgi:hypothetical protein
MLWVGGWLWQASAGTGLKTLHAAIQQSARDVEKMKQRLTQQLGGDREYRGRALRMDSDPPLRGRAGGRGGELSQALIDEQVTTRTLLV